MRPHTIAISGAAVALAICLSFTAFAEGPAGVVLYYRAGSCIFLLLASEPSRGWNAFGGGAQVGETESETAARETEEETRGYFKREWLQQRISKQEPHRSFGYSMYFVEVPFVPAQRVMNNPLKADAAAMAERRFYAWVPFSTIEPILKKEELTPEDLAIDPLYVPGGSNPEKFRRIWIANMREAMKSGAFPWDSGQIGSNPDKKLR